MLNWKQVEKLAPDLQEQQVTLMLAACPEAMSIKELAMWVKLCVKAVSYVTKLETDGATDRATTTEETRMKHWARVKDHALLQLKRSAEAVGDYLETAEELSGYERCQIFDILGTASEAFCDYVADAKAKEAAQGSANEVPSSVSAATLELLAKLQSRRGS